MDLDFFPQRLSVAVFCVAALVGAVLGIPAQASQESPAVKTSSVKLAGLKQEAEILIDRWGVPHIYAASQDDVFFAQGYNAARDRLFQIDLWRRRGLGRLASVFGSAYVEQDRASRLFLYRGDMQKEWKAYGRNAEGIAERFVSGINAYIDEVLADPAKLPLEFRTQAYTPREMAGRRRGADSQPRPDA
jgi:penicillin amidase